MTQVRPQGQNDGGQNDGGQNQDIEPPGFIERWSNYLLSRFEEDDEDRYQEPGAKLRKFRPEDIPESEDPRAPKRGADGDAPGQGGAKRVRRRGPAELADAMLAEEGIHDPELAGDGPPPGRRAAGAARRGAQSAGAADEEEGQGEGQGEEQGEGSWWDYALNAI